MSVFDVESILAVMKNYKGKCGDIEDDVNTAGETCR